MDRRTLLDQALLGHTAAVEFNAALIDCAHVWDDLIDRDKPVAPADINRAFMAMLVDIPGNAFYQQHFAQLHPLLSVATTNWMTANALEASGVSADLNIAFIIRSDYCNVLLKSIEIVGGREHALAVWPEVRRFVHAEGYDGYLKSLAAEQAAREGN